MPHNIFCPILIPEKETHDQLRVGVVAAVRAGVDAGARSLGPNEGLSPGQVDLGCHRGPLQDEEKDGAQQTLLQALPL